VAKLYFFRLDGGENRVELEAGNFVMIDANVLAPIVKKSHPIAERSDFCAFSRHDFYTS